MTERLPVTVDVVGPRPIFDPGEHQDPIVNILTCVKRVPMTGGTIVLTADAQAIETRHLGFTISPHEECGVEEAVRLVEQHGGEAVVLTLGPAEAEEQLRDCMAIGADRAVHLVTDGGSGTLRRPRDAILGRDRGGARGRDRVRPDRVRQRVGRLGELPGRDPRRPCARVARRHRSEGDLGGRRRLRCEREAAGGRDVYDVPLPAVVTVLEGLNLPRYPSVPGRIRAKTKPVAASTPARPAPLLEKIGLVVPEGQGKQAEVLGDGAAAAPRVVELLTEIGVL